MVRRLCIFLFLVVFVSYALPVTQHYQSGHVLPARSHSTANSSDPPTVSWWGFLDNSTETLGLLVDGSYIGQTEQVFSFKIRVNDSDGVDTIIFRFYYQEEWLNRTPVLVEGDEFDGSYEGRLVCSVTWDWTKSRPNPDGHAFLFKAFVNDTLGNWRETSSFSYSYGYWYVVPPPPVCLVTTPIGWTIIVLSVFGIAVVIRRRRRFRQTAPEVGDNASLQ